MRKVIFFAFVIGLATSCEHAPEGVIALSGDEVESKLQEALISAKAGDEIIIPEGTYSFQRSLSLFDIPNVTIKGAGKKKTICSFDGQIEGA